MTTQTFENIAQRREPRFAAAGAYGYDRPSPYLFIWSGLLQAIVSQTLSHRLGGEFHTNQAGIYKAEGGCHIVGRPGLVLASDSCYYDFGGRTKKDEAELRIAAELITDLVVRWDPMDPVDSMLRIAAEHLGRGAGLEELKAALEAMPGRGNPFSANALSSFFRWNPFSKAPIPEDYERWCLISVQGEDEAEVDQMYADRRLGESLYARLKEVGHESSSYTSVMCCSPRRDREGNLAFWINTGRTTQIDGWKTEQEIEAFLASGEKLRDKPRD